MTVDLQMLVWVIVLCVLQAFPYTLALIAKLGPIDGGRYENETARLYGVLDRRLAGREFVAGEDYSIADMAIYPWIATLERNQKRLDDFPNLKRWTEAIAARPATIRAYEKGKAINQAPTITEESKKLLFGQGAARRVA